MQFFQILEYIGIFAFALNGAFVGIEYKFDYFGIPFLAIITAMGGGILRDVSLGNTPPIAFTNIVYVSIAVGVAALCILFFFLLRKKLTNRHLPKIVTVINIFDAIGLAVFTVSGAQIAINSGESVSLLTVVFSSTLSAIGGGIIRDVIANRKPLVLRKEIYAIAAILGAILYFYLVKTPLGTLYSTVICVTAILAVRFVSMRRKINLPHFNDSRALLRDPGLWDKREVTFEGEADDMHDNRYF